jgi:hypothetical protein
VPDARVKRRSGQFGIGFKHAVGWLWGKTTVRTMQAGLSGTVYVNWEEWARSNDWDALPNPITRPYAGPSGLAIRCDRIDRAAPSPDQLGALTREAAFLFNPALRRDVQIICAVRRGAKIQWNPVAAPERTDVVERGLTVQGKGLTINVGIVPSAYPNPRPGLHYYRAHRLIKAMSTLGCGRVNPARIFGWVELDRAWRVSIHKDDIVDPAVDAMALAIEEAIREVLDKAGTIAEVIAVHNLETELSARLTGALGAGGGTRSPSEPRAEDDSEDDAIPPRIKPKRRAPPSPSEALRERIKRGGIRVLFGEFEPAKGIGFVEANPLTIHLNKAHAQVARVLQQKQHHLQLGGAHQLAVSLLAYYVAEDERGKQLVLPKMGEAIGASRAEAYSLALGNFLGILHDDL